MFFFLIVGSAAVLARELPGLIRRHCLREIIAVATIFFAAVYYAASYVFHIEPFSPLATIAEWFERSEINYDTAFRLLGLK